MDDPVAEIRARLSGPGGEFELAPQEIRGQLLPGFVNRRARLRDWLADSTAFGDRECLVDGERRLGFAAHTAAVAGLAARLADDYGVRPGDRVAILAGNSPDWLIAFWAANSLGAIVVAGNAWWTAREATQALGRTAPRVIVADPKRADRVRGLDVALLPIAEAAATGGTELPDVPVGADDPAIVMFTSGTSGQPKGAIHSHRNLLAVIEYHRYTDAVQREMTALIGLPARTEPRRFLMSLPLFHIASLHNLALPRLATGDTIVIDAGRFDVDRVLGLVERERITNWAIVPTMAHRLATHPAAARYDLSSLTALSINSAPSSPELKDRVRALVPTVQAAIADSYGLTESSTAATVATPLDLAAFPTSVGRAIPSVEIRINEPDASTGEGEIWLRSQFNLLGYWDDPAATAATLDANGWLHTGDLGRYQDGRLFMASRRSDLILRGGENVYPAEVEAVLAEHPAVVECAVFGVDDADLGQAVAAVVVAAGPLTEADLSAYAAERLAYYKVPAHWKLTREPLHRTATGKVIRSTLHLS